MSLIFDSNPNRPASLPILKMIELDIITDREESVNWRIEKLSKAERDLY